MQLPRSTAVLIIDVQLRPLSTELIDFHRLLKLLMPCFSWRKQYVLVKELEDSLRDHRCKVTSFNKPDNDLMAQDSLKIFFQNQDEQGLQQVIVVGCTTTCCVRLTAMSLKRLFPSTELCVDLSLYATRKCNYMKRCAPCMNRYLNVNPQHACICQTTDASTHTSPQDKTVADMRDVGIHVFDIFLWQPYIIWTFLENVKVVSFMIDFVIFGSTRT